MVSSNAFLDSVRFKAVTNAPEVRYLIWHHVVDFRYIHVLQDARVACTKQGDEVCKGPIACHKHLSCRDIQCVNYIKLPPQRWLMCCRQIFCETTRMRFERTIVSFTSSQAFCRRLLPTCALALKQLRQVRLNIGPAKYGEAPGNKANKQALRILSSQATNLQSLFLTTSFYYGAQTDRILLSNKLLKLLNEFRGLTLLSLHIDLPPGPVAGIFDQDVVACILFRLKCLGAVLRYHTYQQRPSDSPSVYDPVTIRTVKEQALALIQERV